MLLATKTLGATRGGAVAGTGVGVGAGVGVDSGVGLALGGADTVAVGLGDGAELAALGVPHAASNTGAIRVSSTFLVIIGYLDLERGRKGAGDVPPSAGWETVAAFCMFTGILLASEIFQT
jgi:hypothetical protein